MLIRIIKSYRDIVVVCDSDLIGKTFEREGKILEIKENFYRGEEKTSEEIREIMENMLREDATFNIVGKNSVELAIKTGVIKKESVKEIGGVSFAMKLL